MTLPRSRLVIVTMRDPDDLNRDWAELFTVICRTLWSGRTVLVRRRAAMVICLTLALLRETTLQESEAYMLRRSQCGV